MIEEITSEVLQKEQEINNKKDKINTLIKQLETKNSQLLNAAESAKKSKGPASVKAADISLDRSDSFKSKTEIQHVRLSQDKSLSRIPTVPEPK